MSITVTPSSYNSTPDENKPNTEYILNPGAKINLNEFYTHFGI